MKTTFLLSLLLVFSLNILAEQAGPIKRISLKKVNSGKGPGTRSVEPLDVSAYLILDDNTFVIDFLGEHNNVQILVKNALTNETIYLDSYATPINIVITMPEVDRGEYLLEISLGESLLSGGFSIE